MNYQEFLEYIKEHLPKLMNEKELYKLQQHGNDQEVLSEICYEANLHTITKNNGVMLDGITLLNKGENAAPNIYLNPYFDSYQMGKPLNTILEEIIDCYNKTKEEKSFEVVNILDYEQVKHKIVIRIVNFEKNEKQLQECPYKPFLDLAITFRYLADKDNMGVASSLISNKEFEVWGIELDELYKVALENTMREFPWKMDSLVKVVSECFGEFLPLEMKEDYLDELNHYNQLENRVNMFVLTNELGLNGATCILYEQVLYNFAKVQDCNIYILPSSVHEVMLVPENDETQEDFLRELVVEANQSAVGLIDLLSDNIYYYDRTLDKVLLCGELY